MPRNSPNKSLTEYPMEQDEVDRVSIALQTIVHSVATRAYQHIETAKSHMSSADSTDCLPTSNRPTSAVIKQSFPALINAVPAQMYLKSLEANKFDLLRTGSQRNSIMLPLRLWLRMKRVKLV